MEPLNHDDDETLPIFILKKTPKKGREKETKSNDQSRGKQKSPKEANHKEVREP
jgi:hypothetical protein